MKNYVGSRRSDSKYVFFRSESVPTEASHGKIYRYVIGPFRTVRGARFMAEYGKGNPHVQTVGECERIAALESKQKGRSK